MTDTTTIQIRKEQKEKLDELKEHGGEPYKSVLQGLIIHYEANRTEPDEIDEDRVWEIANNVVDQRCDDE